jgi:hypothetical protein
VRKKGLTVKVAERKICLAIQKMKYVAFLRGINVGGNNKIKMKTLREMCAALV